MHSIYGVFGVSYVTTDGQWVSAKLIVHSKPFILESGMNGRIGEHGGKAVTEQDEEGAQGIKLNYPIGQQRLWMAFYLPLEGDTRNTGVVPPGNSHQLDRKYRNICSQISVVNI